MRMAGAAAAVIGESGGSFVKGLISALPSHCLQTCPSGEASGDAGLSSLFLEIGAPASFSDSGERPLDLGSAGVRSLSSVSK